MNALTDLLAYLFYGIGGSLCWTAKGFRTNLKEEFSHDRKVRNAVVAIIVFLVLIGALFYANNYR